MTTILGNLDPNEIIGTNLANTIQGLDGNDTLRGLLGDDLLNGNRGNDLLFGGEGNDLLYGGRDDDTLFGDDGNDTLFGDLGNDLLQGNAGDDFLFGLDGDDILRGGNGSDNLSGGEGDDTLYGDIGDDFVNGNQGNDEILGGDGSDTLRGGQGDDILIGGFGDDFLWGDRGNDTLTGGTGSDRFVLQSLGRTLITDYDDTEDFLVIDENDISFDDLTWASATTISRDNSLVESTVFSLKSTGKVIAILEGVSSRVIDVNDFLTINGQPVTSSGSGTNNTQTPTNTGNTNQQEDINDLTEAEDLGTLNGTLTIDNGSLSDSNIADIYRFRLESDATFRAVMNNLSANADIQLIQDDGNGIIEEADIRKSSENTGTLAERVEDPLTAGVYYVRVLRVEGDTTYDLTLTV
ncbi:MULTISPECIES: calcium-binding protein [Planktothricoides]|uniref:Calcium-binding protein n=2 Tax=Planktothricoides raciborskii TaxID=132608 RepID=A0AAU8JJ33_9CYAN|nr:MULTISPECIES: calcium-binding protein [Planktothricoides]MBD2544457.1 pre-peptidase C-terminal domain-containing protein [Planktothricoides raciborskii FACHB-1370]MBD2585720.1 pre-peptidase C-terminal domain-containing protein [Planktothricoides raciborskii FACHB-1261]